MMAHANLAPWINTLDVGDRCYVSWEGQIQIRWTDEPTFSMAGGDYFSYLGHDAAGLHFARKGSYIVLTAKTLRICRVSQ